MLLCWTVSQGDISELSRLVANGVNLEEADYDGRTTLHLAASNGLLETVTYLIKQHDNPTPKDRFQALKQQIARVSCSQASQTDIQKSRFPHKQSAAK